MTVIFILSLFVILALILFLIKKWANGPLNSNKKDLKGKLIIITGSSDGIGLIAAKDLLNSNAKVIFACRNKTKTEEKINELPENLRKNAIFIQLDLQKFKSIENFVKEIKSKYPKIDILINNAGMSSAILNKTEDGYLNTYQVNYLSTALLTLLLLDHFNENESKIINLSSVLYKNSKLTYGDSKLLNNYDLMEKRYNTANPLDDYSDSKLLLLYFTQYLADYCEKKCPYLKVVCLHPGVIFTKIFNMEKLYLKIIFSIIKPILYCFTKDVVHGAQTTLFLSYSDNKDLVNGGYYNNLKLEKYVLKGKDEKLRNELVNETLNILKSKYNELEKLPLLSN